MGSFCTDPILSERLFVAIEKKYYEAPSFIANGPIKKIELHHDHSVCVLDTLDPTKVGPQLPDLTSALEEKLATLPKTLGFQPDRHRDQFLLIADLIDLFGALTLKELYELIQVMGVKIDHEHLKRITSQLLRFELIRFIPGATKRFFVAPPDRFAYLNYSGHPGSPVFDRGRFKLMKVTPWLNADKPRLKAYQEIHPKA